MIHGMQVRSLTIIAATIGLSLALLGAAQSFGQGESETKVPSIELNGELNSAEADWIGHGLNEAADAGAPFAIIRLETDGGLKSSAQEIVDHIRSAPMPVVVYVSPSGARAASAGLFVTQAADVAAMAPETNIGSASPISSTGADIGDTLGRKITNDAAAFVRALATSHGRNPDLAERMVTEATNVTSAEALDANLIDLVATDQDDLLSQLDGFAVQGPKATTLDTSGYTLDQRDMPFQYDLLQILVNPNVAFLLLLVGFVGITLEFFSPGAILPGSVGVVALLLGLFGTVQLPVEAMGVVLLILAAGLIVAEAHLPTGGLLGVAGIGALIAGGLLLFNTGSGGISISPVLVVIVALFFGGLLILAGRKALTARRSPFRTGEDELVGSEGVVRVAVAPVGQVFVAGALWRARAVDPSAPIEVGYRVRVEAVDGLTLAVGSLGERVPERAEAPVVSNLEGS